VTTLDLHSHCHGPLGIDQNESGWFWDAGVKSVVWHDNDHWSVGAATEYDTWTEFAVSPLVTPGEPQRHSLRL